MIYNRILFLSFAILINMWAIALFSGCKTQKMEKERFRTENVKQEKLNSKINYQSLDTGAKQVTKLYQVSKLTTRTVKAKGKNIEVKPDGSITGVEDYSATDKTAQTEKSDSSSNEKFGKSTNFQEEINRQLKEQHKKDSLTKKAESDGTVKNNTGQWPLIILAALLGTGFLLFFYLKGKK